jgi:Holliday junction resolvase RusA-like endonuclease
LKPGDTATYAANPFYDEILVFAGIKVPTSQDFYKLIDKNEQIYKLIKKPNVQEFKKTIKKRLLNKKKPWWPHERNLTLSISIGGNKNYIEFNDLDNYLKTIFDSIKGIVIKDDNIITSVTIDKEENQFVNGFMITIKLDPIEGEPDYNYGENIEKWEEDRQLKIERGGICCMDSY